MPNYTLNFKIQHTYYIYFINTCESVARSSDEKRDGIENGQKLQRVTEFTAKKFEYL